MECTGLLGLRRCEVIILWNENCRLLAFVILFQQNQLTVLTMSAVFYVSEKHRGFAFVEFELAEDAAAAIDNLVIMYNDAIYTGLYYHYPIMSTVNCKYLYFNQTMS